MDDIHLWINTFLGMPQGCQTVLLIFGVLFLLCALTVIGQGEELKRHEEREKKELERIAEDNRKREIIEAANRLIEERETIEDKPKRFMLTDDGEISETFS